MNLVNLYTGGKEERSAFAKYAKNETGARHGYKSSHEADFLPLKRAIHLDVAFY